MPVPKKFGGLSAPPKNNMHILQNVRSLNQKLKEQDNLIDLQNASGTPTADNTNQGNQENTGEGQNKEGGDDLMNLLMGIDFG